MSALIWELHLTQQRLEKACLRRSGCPKAEALASSPPCCTHSPELQNLFQPLHRQPHRSIPGLSSGRRPKHPPAPGMHPHGGPVPTSRGCCPPVFPILEAGTPVAQCHSGRRSQGILIPSLPPHSGKSHRLHLQTVSGTRPSHVTHPAAGAQAGATLIPHQPHSGASGTF